MDIKRWNNYLEKLGLTESEIAVYLAGLKEGPQTVLQLSKKTRLSRVTVYSVIDSLQQKRLLSSVQKGKKQFFAAEPPERLVSVAEGQLHEMKSTIEEIKTNLQELKFVQSGDKPVVKLFEGAEAFQAISEDMLETGVQSFLEFGNLDEIDRVYPNGELFPFQEEILRRKIGRRIVYLTEQKKYLLENNNPKRRSNVENSLFHYLHPSNYNKHFYGDVLVYDKKVWLSSFRGKQISVMVESAEIAGTIEEMFNQLWDHLEKKEA